MPKYHINLTRYINSSDNLLVVSLADLDKT